MSGARTLEFNCTGIDGTTYSTAKVESLPIKSLVIIYDEGTYRRIDQWNLGKTQLTRYFSSDSLATLAGLLESGRYYSTTIVQPANGKTQNVILFDRNIKRFYDNNASVTNTTFLFYNLGNVDIQTFVVNSTYANFKAAFIETDVPTGFSAGNGTETAPAYSFTSDTRAGIYRIGANDYGFAVAGATVQEWVSSGSNLTGNFVATGVVASTNFHLNDGGGSIIGYWDSTGMHLQVINEKTTDAGVTIETILLKDGNITLLAGGNLILDAATGTKIGTATAQKLGFWNKTPIIQPTNGISAAAYVPNAGIDTATFGGYTIGQLAAVLINTGLAA